MNTIFECYCDGATEPVNPGGNMGVGAVIFPSAEPGTPPLKEYSHYIQAAPANSNNVAEYLAFKWLMESLLDIIPAPDGKTVLTPDKKPKVNIFGDSQLVVMQMNGAWRMKGGMYMKTAIICQELLRNLNQRANVTIAWIPRDENWYADGLSKKGLVAAGVEFKLQKEGIKPSGKKTLADFKRN